MTSNSTLFTPLTRIAATTLLTLGLFVQTGCLINSYTREEESGTHISQTTLNQIQPGSTTQDWVSSVLGKPARTDTFNPVNSEQTGEIWVYEWQRTRSSSGSIIFILGSSSKKRESATYYIEFLNGIVSRIWSDQY